MKNKNIVVNIGILLLVFLILGTIGYFFTLSSWLGFVIYGLIGDGITFLLIYKKILKLETMDVFLSIFYLSAIWLFDINALNMADNGFLGVSHIIPSVPISAFFMYYLTLIAMFLINGFFIVSAIAKKEKNEIKDLIAGIVGFASIAILWTSSMLMITEGKGWVMPFLNVTTLSLYHFGGVALGVFAVLYFALSNSKR